MNKVISDFESEILGKHDLLHGGVGTVNGPRVFIALLGYYLNKHRHLTKDVTVHQIRHQDEETP
jgi:hypothetical protein